ncbi:uncharacterized protein LOC103989917 isoform X2 [Musa acuminata AAA Group]|uniref:uncharacterized protein LOC103989917 isoform X2 n=1 Tax=Musa acuminata AAA Group TaxID=214697 RepID=UPI0031D86097
MRRGMEMESEDVEEELEEMNGGLDTPRGAAPETEEGGGGEAEQRSVYYDEDQEGGFNIFHIFEKGKDTHVQSSEQVPEKKINWISSIFKVDRSKTKESEPEASATEALAHSDVRINATEQTTRDAEISDDRFSGPPGVSFEEQMDDQPELHDSVTQTISTSEAMIQTKELIYAGVKDNDGRMRDDSGVDATKITSQSDQIIQSSEATTTEVLAHSDVRINVLEQIARDTEISNDRLSGPSSVSFKGHMEDQSELHDPATQTITTLGAMFQIKESIDAGVKENDVRLRMMDESGVDASKITFQNEQIIQDSETNATEVLTHSDIAINVAEQTARVSYKEQTEDQPELQDPSTQTISTSEAMIQIKELIDDGVNDNDVRMKDDSGVDANKITSQSDQIIQGSETSTTEVLAHSDVRINVAEQTARDTEISNDWDILKSIVYGGLNESITSLAVVSSAAGADVSTSF